MLGNVLSNDFPTWTSSLNISYPIGRSTQEARLERARVQHSRAQAQRRNQELQITTQVRQAARQVQTNQQRVQTTRASREYADRYLEAEQRKFAAGTSTNYFFFFSSRRRHTSWNCDWSSDVCSSD